MRFQDYYYNRVAQVIALYTSHNRRPLSSHLFVQPIPVTGWSYTAYVVLLAAQPTEVLLLLLPFVRPS
jgi:hypothetical protein